MRSILNKTTGKTSLKMSRTFGIKPYNYKDPLNFEELLTSEEQYVRNPFIYPPF